MYEESKGSTSSKDSEFDSDTNPLDLPKKASIAAKVMPGVYLSTNLITEKNLTLADIKIESFTLEVIETMGSELIRIVSKFKTKSLLVDPKAELKRQK